MARCRVHADNRKERKGRICRDDKGKEEESGTIDDKVQMLCERLSTTSCGKDERKRAPRKTSKVRGHPPPLPAPTWRKSWKFCIQTVA